MTCSEFYSYVLSDSKLLNAAASGQKYCWLYMPLGRSSYRSFDPEASTSGQTDGVIVIIGILLMQ